MLAVRDRLRALAPSAAPVDESEPPGERGLAMLLSLVVALVMWFSFSMRETYSVEVRLPVEIAQTPARQALRELPPTEVTATLRGEGWTLLSLTRRLTTLQVVAEDETVNMMAAIQGTGLPPNVDVVGVDPEVIALALDVRTSRRLPIRLRSSIQTVAPYDLLRAPRLQPDSVTVTGAQSLLGRLDDWPTEVLLEDNVQESLARTVALADTFGGLLTPSVRATRVAVDVGEFTEGRRVLDVEVTNLPDDIVGVRFDPARVTAIYRVPTVGDTYERALSTSGFRAVVDYFDIRRNPADGEVPVSVRWPADLDVRDVTLSPSRVEYFIQRRPTPSEGEE
ncbi:hypothetical protein [Rubrivirga sp. IMCC45206]|uniref:hypothetical protein n=1 Tax=Rubrivirga sp. IMCC45206 TaxID=3391614 RepID=UPI00398FA62F